MDCIHQNGDITGYSVLYGEQGHVSMKTMSVVGENTMEATIHGLTSNVIYSVSVAAVNSGGLGAYSHPFMVLVAGKHNCQVDENIPSCSLFHILGLKVMPDMLHFIRA